MKTSEQDTTNDNNMSIVDDDHENDADCNENSNGKDVMMVSIMIQLGQCRWYIFNFAYRTATTNFLREIKKSLELLPRALCRHHVFQATLFRVHAS